jgi:hypothetical protein
VVVVVVVVAGGEDGEEEEEEVGASGMPCMRLHLSPNLHLPRTKLKQICFVVD